MAKKERNKRAARKARQAKRQEVEAGLVTEEGTDAKAPAKPAQKEADKPKAKADGKPGLIKRTGMYFGDVRSEMRRVVWPSRADLKSYTIAVIVMLVLFGLAVWLIDTGVVAALVGYSGLRG